MQLTLLLCRVRNNLTKICGKFVVNLTMRFREISAVEAYDLGFKGMDDPMNSNTTLFLIFSVLIGAIAATSALTAVNYPQGVTCTGKRVASYGFTNKQIALAELAAIITWQNETEKKKPGFGAWHLANGRSMKCRLFKDSAHFQCQVSALPCRVDRS